MADIPIYICYVCGADLSSVVKTDGTIYYCPSCGTAYGGTPQNSVTDKTEG
jgi:hypothetical protein